MYRLDESLFRPDNSPKKNSDFGLSYGPKPAHVLCIVESEADRMLVSRGLTGKGHAVVSTTSMEEALRFLKTDKPIGFIIISHKLPCCKRSSDFLNELADRRLDHIPRAIVCSPPELAQCELNETPFRGETIVPADHYETIANLASEVLAKAA